MTERRRAHRRRRERQVPRARRRGRQDHLRRRQRRVIADQFDVITDATPEDPNGSCERVDRARSTETDDSENQDRGARGGHEGRRVGGHSEASAVEEGSRSGALSSRVAVASPPWSRLRPDHAAWRPRSSPSDFARLGDAGGAGDGRRRARDPRGRDGRPLRPADLDRPAVVERTARPGPRRRRMARRAPDDRAPRARIERLRRGRRRLDHRALGGHAARALRAQGGPRGRAAAPASRSTPARRRRRWPRWRTPTTSCSA